MADGGPSLEQGLSFTKSIFLVPTWFPGWRKTLEEKSLGPGGEGVKF